MAFKLTDSIAKAIGILNKLADVLTYCLTAYNDYLERKDEIRAKVLLALKIAFLVIFTCGTVLFIFLSVKIIKAIVKKVKALKAQKQLEMVQDLEV